MYKYIEAWLEKEAGLSIEAVRAAKISSEEYVVFMGAITRLFEQYNEKFETLKELRDVMCEHEEASKKQ
jgi:hypothetical protein